MPLTNEMLRERLKNQHWTSHNIRLTGEVSTMPGQPDFIDTDQRLHSVLRVLSVLYRGDFARLRIADLGCLEGGFALALARRGARVIGVEARALNLEKCALLKEHFDLPALEFAQADVKDFTADRFGHFDAVMALGILYHLDRPVEWLRQLASVTKDVLIVETHYAPADDAALADIDPRISNLSPLEDVEVEGHNYKGRWFFEYDKSVDRESQLWASYSNNSSFWLTRESALLAIINAGFDVVFEQQDYTARFFDHFSKKFPRGIFIGIRSASFSQTSK
ncbi:MAG TPA: class I SAM-dependent methyltransferase [Blastocatellia bacterium]|nr:class I SAM-dependent methyltransferase [Blastocatellia bacterium]